MSVQTSLVLISTIYDNSLHRADGDEEHDSGTTFQPDAAHDTY